jgi:phosphoribosylglycinamide formyltransferase-1
MAELKKLNLCVPISGNGSNLKALIDACADPSFPAKIGLVISNKAFVGGLDQAKKAHIPTLVIDYKAYPTRADFDRVMTKAMEDDKTELICLAGFMRLLSDEFCDHWRDRMINIHPSLLPSFKGLNVQQAAIDAGVRFSGCTVHYVRKEIDTGPIIVQAAVPLLSDDAAEELAARILIEEHKIYPYAVRLIAEGRVLIQNERALISKHKTIPSSIINPAHEGW